MIASAEASGWRFDPAPSMKLEALDFAHNAPLDPAFSSLSAPPEITIEPPPPPAPQEQAEAPEPSDAQETARSSPPVPLPVPRPAEPQAPSRPEAPQTAGAPPLQQQTRVAALPTAPANNPTFLERLFGVQPGPSPAPDAATAVYDISAKVVYMPNGEKLEAHSGLGDKLDDPRYVHVRMHGPTPPGIYDLTEREKLFHGVRALRMNPVGGSGTVYGRNGLLAHTFMLGPKGDSNGCVSFKNYDRFLQAYLKGEVKRLMVVTGRGQDAVPRIVTNPTGTPQRSASSASNT